MAPAVRRWQRPVEKHAIGVIASLTQRPENGLAEAGGTGATAVNSIGSAGFYGVNGGGLRVATGGTKNIPFGNGLATAKDRFLPEWMSPTDEQTDGVPL